MKQAMISTAGALMLAAVISLGGAARAEAGGCPTYTTYYANGYSSNYCVPSYYPTPSYYSPGYSYTTWTYPVYTRPTYFTPPATYQAPYQYHTYYSYVPTYTYPPYHYGWHY